MKKIKLTLVAVCLLLLICACNILKNESDNSASIQGTTQSQTSNETPKIYSEQEFITTLQSHDDLRGINNDGILSKCYTEHGSIKAAVLSVQMEDADNISQTKTYLALEQSGEISAYALALEDSVKITAVSISTLDVHPVIGIAGRLDSAIVLLFYAINDEELVNLEVDNWVSPKDNLTIVDNKIVISDAKNFSVTAEETPTLFRVESETELLYSIIHSKSNYYENPSDFSVRLMYGSWELRQVSEQYTYLNEDWEYSPFDETIPELLVQNTDVLLKKPWRMPLPSGYSCLTACNGDLTGDGLDDIAAVIEQCPGMDSGSRVLYILIAQKNGSYIVRWHSDANILGRCEGGVFGDPFEGVEIENGALAITHYGGSSDRWGFTYTYSVQKDDLLLVRAEELRESTHTANGTIVSYDVATGLIEERTLAHEEYDGLLLSSFKTAPDKVIYFGDGTFDLWTFWGSLESDKELSPPLPSLYRVRYGEPSWETPLQITAQQALDKVRNAHYPGLKKVNYSYGQEIIDNYEKILCYDLPNNYYNGSNVSLYYGGLSDPMMGDGHFHIIYVKTPNSEESSRIYISCSTGEIDYEQSHIPVENEFSREIKALYNVLLGREMPFCPDVGKYAYMFSNMFQCDDLFDETVTIARFTLVDMDGDSTPEVILEIDELGGRFIVLRYSEDEVCAYAFVYRALYSLKNDGSFVFSGGAADNGYGMLRFADASCETVVMGEMRSNIKHEITYYIANKEVTEKGYYSFIDKQDKKQNAEWYTVANIEELIAGVR